MQNAVASVPFYQDWTFWAVLLAAAALVLSQLPPVRQIIRSTRLLVKPYDRVNVTEWLGNPNLFLHLLLTNDGGREVKVLSTSLEVTRDDGRNVVLPGQSFSRPDGSQGSLLLTQFRLKPGEDWGAYVSFFTSFSSTNERRSKQLIKELRQNIVEKAAARSPDEVEENALVVGDEHLVDEAKSFHSDHHFWEPGEYAARLTITCDPDKGSASKKLRFTIFESDVQEFEERTERFMYGQGVCFEDPQRTEVYARIHEV